MRIFKSKRFARFARRESISDARLCIAIQNAERGLIDADYGGGVIKQRIARPGEGMSKGYRSIILFRKGKTWEVAQTLTLPVPPSLWSRCF